MFMTVSVSHSGSIGQGSLAKRTIVPKKTLLLATRRAIVKLFYWPK